MSRRVLGLLLFTVACGGPNRGPAPIGNASTGATGPAAVPCPTGTELETAARKAWAATAAISLVPSCVAVRSAPPLWLINGYAEYSNDDGSFVDVHTALVATDGTVTAIESDPGLPPAAIERAGATYTAVDFDGDGKDELLIETGYMHGGYEQEWVGVRGVTADGKFVASAAPNLPLSSDNSAADPDPADVYTCGSTHQVIDRSGGGRVLEIVGEAATGPVNAQDCPAVGRHTYGWDGAKLVELAP